VVGIAILVPVFASRATNDEKVEDQEI
jgi:hypothetical protein